MKEKNKELMVAHEKLFLEPKVLNKLVCCDCGLVHVFKYRRTLRGVILELWDAPAETKLERKRRSLARIKK